MFLLCTRKNTAMNFFPLLIGVLIEAPSSFVPKTQRTHTECLNCTKRQPHNTCVFTLYFIFLNLQHLGDIRLETRGNSSCAIRAFRKGMRRSIAVTSKCCFSLPVAFRKRFPFRLKNWVSHLSPQLQIKSWQSHRVVLYILGAVNNESGVE